MIKDIYIYCETCNEMTLILKIIGQYDAKHSDRRFEDIDLQYGRYSVCMMHSLLL
jgi:hypothetical protein